MFDPVTPELCGCERHDMRLTHTACVRLWQSCKDRRPAPWEGRAECVTCRTGAERAGYPAPPPTLADGLRHVCARCLAVRDRMVGRYCISCYNRNREAQIGRNGKGTRPGLADRLHTVRLTVGNGGSARTISFEHVTGRLEAMMISAKASTGPVYLGRARWTP